MRTTRYRVSNKTQISMIKRFKHHLLFPAGVVLGIPVGLILVRVALQIFSDLLSRIMQPLYDVDWTNPLNLGVLLICGAFAVIALYAAIMTALDSYIEWEVRKSGDDH